MSFDETFDKYTDKYTCFDQLNEDDSVKREQFGRRPSINDQPSGTMNEGRQDAAISLSKKRQPLQRLRLPFH